MVKNFNIYETSLDFFKDKKNYVFLYMILNISYPLGSVIVPHYYGKIIENIISNSPMKDNILKTAGTWIISIIGTFLLTQIDNVVIPEFRSYLYKKIAKFVFEKYKQNYTTLKIGELISKLSKLPFLILEVFYQIRNNYIPLLYMSVFSIVYFFNINKKLGTLICLILFCFLGLMYSSFAMCIPSCINSESCNDKSNEELQDILENILNVYTTDMIDNEIINIGVKDKDADFHFKKCLQCSSKYKTLFSITYLVSFCGIIFCMFDMFKKKEIGISEINSIFMVLLYLLSSIDNTLQYSQDTSTYIGSIIDIQNYIDNLNKDTHIAEVYINKMNENLHNNEITNIEGKIEFKNISVCFKKDGKDICILENFSYIIEPKTKLAITGSVGKGKSTLLKMILKLSYPTSGNILIDDKNLPYDVIRKYVSYIPQNPVLFNRTLYKNIVYGTDKTKEDVQYIMNKYDLNDVFGIHTLESDVGKGGSNLSGGQKQMVIILRAMLRNSSVILLDEPTSSLDGKLKMKMMDLIFKVFSDKTVITITHDPDIIPMFGKVLNL